MGVDVDFSYWTKGTLVVVVNSDTTPVRDDVVDLHQDKRIVPKED